MTKAQEKAKRQLEIIKAFAEGKQLQGMYLHGGYDVKYEDWSPDDELDFSAYEYRIKPEAKIRPYTFKEMCKAVKKHGILVREKNRNEVWTICSFDNELVNSSFNYFEMMEFVWFDDDSPCGIVEEE